MTPEEFDTSAVIGTKRDGRTLSDPEIDWLVAPFMSVVIACGGAVPQASGRRLGLTGGTLHKLESFAGFTCELLKQRIRQRLCDVAGLDRRDLSDTPHDGSAMDAFRDLIAVQAGDLSVPLWMGAHAETVLAGKTGTMGDIDANAVGLASWRVGAGRAQQGDGWTDGEPTRRPLPSALRASGSLSLIVERIVA